MTKLKIQEQSLLIKRGIKKCARNLQLRANELLQSIDQNIKVYKIITDDPCLKLRDLLFCK